MKDEAENAFWTKVVWIAGIVVAIWVIAYCTFTKFFK
jgi:hypothetical protein